MSESKATTSLVPSFDDFKRDLPDECAQSNVSDALLYALSCSAAKQNGQSVPTPEEFFSSGRTDSIPHKADKVDKVDEFPSLADIKKTLPQECFQSNVGTSLLYALRTVMLSLGLGCALYATREYNVAKNLVWIFGGGYVQGDFVANMVDYVFALCYILLQGTVMWGAFTIGHDCGHGSFSRYPLVNWLVGNVCHSIILTPYESWRMSHRSHHKNTGNMDKDEIFYPNSQTHHKLFTRSLGGVWFGYLLFSNTPGRRNYLAYFNSEFARQRIAILASFATIGLVFRVIYIAVQTFGWAVVGLYYGAPVFVFASWLVVVTFLHHNDEDTPWYRDSAWDYVKGNLSSVDRDYGAFVNNISHNIHLHQIHHLFPIIPHYCLPMATNAFKTAFPQLYRVRSGSIIAAFIRAMKDWIVYGSYADDATCGDVFQYSTVKLRSAQPHQKSD